MRAGAIRSSPNRRRSPDDVGAIRRVVEQREKDGDGLGVGGSTQNLERVPPSLRAHVLVREDGAHAGEHGFVAEHGSKPLRGVPESRVVRLVEAAGDAIPRWGRRRGTDPLKREEKHHQSAPGSDRRE